MAASGAAFGLLGALLAYGWRRGGFAGQQVRSVAIQWLVFALIYGFAVPGIDNAAHIGGAITGFGIAATFSVYQLQRGRESDAMRLLAVGCMLLVLVCIGCCVFAFFTRQYR